MGRRKRFPFARVPATFVLDVSAAIPFVVRQLATEYRERLVQHFFRTAALVPESWLLDVAEEAFRFEQLGWCSAADVTRNLSVLDGYPIRVDSGLIDRAWGDVLALARTHALPVSRAAYLELAARRGLPLATTDAALTRAAAAAGVPLFTP